MATKSYLCQPADGPTVSWLAAKLKASQALWIDDHADELLGTTAGRTDELLRATAGRDLQEFWNLARQIPDMPPVPPMPAVPWGLPPDRPPTTQAAIDAADRLLEWCVEARPKPVEVTEVAVTKGQSHSSDFISIRWSGTSYTFTKSQAVCVKILWEAWEAGTPELHGGTIVAQADVSQTRLVDVFRSKGTPHPAWGTMIVQGQKGCYRLNDSNAIPTSGRRHSRKTTRKTHR